MQVEETVEAGLAAAADGLDVAVLDVLLRGREVFPVADLLAKRGRPIVFHSGHADREELTSRYDTALALSKPARPEDLISAVAAQVAAKAA